MMIHPKGKLFLLLLAAAAMAGCATSGQAPVETGAPAPADQPAGQSPTAPGKGQEAPAPQAANVTVYVMSKCPYAIKTLDRLFPAMEQLGDRARLRLDYIVTEEKGSFSALHGEDEVKGNKLQLCAIKLASKPAAWRTFIACQNRAWRTIPAGWEACADRAGIARDALTACAGGERGDSLLRASMKRAMEYGAKGSPTIVIGGSQYSGSRTARAFLRGICPGLRGAPPAACADLPPQVEVQLVLLNDSRCKRCKLDRIVEGLRSRNFPRLTVTRLDYADKEGRELFKQLGLRRLPAVLFKAGVERAEGYPAISRWMKLQGTYRMLRIPADFDPTAEICDNNKDDNGDGKVDCQDATCREVLVCRKEQLRRLDLFVMSQCPFGVRALDSMREVLRHFKGKIDFRVHYIAEEKEAGGFKALHGEPEVEENIRQLCARKLYGKRDRYMKYIWCRNKEIRSDQWRQCAVGGISAARMARCVERHGDVLLSKDLRVASALGFGASPTWLVNNRHKANGISAEQIKINLCKHNQKLAGCEATLSSETASVGDASCGPGEAKPAAPRSPDAAQPTETGPEAYKVGVAECDDYVRKFLTCVRTKLPEDTQALLERALRVTAAKWRETAASGKGRADLAAGCVAALKAARSAMSSYGCKW